MSPSRTNRSSLSSTSFTADAVLSPPAPITSAVSDISVSPSRPGSAPLAPLRLLALVRGSVPAVLRPGATPDAAAATLRGLTVLGVVALVLLLRGRLLRGLLSRLGLLADLRLLTGLRREAVALLLGGLPLGFLFLVDLLVDEALLAQRPDVVREPVDQQADGEEGTEDHHTGRKDVQRQPVHHRGLRGRRRRVLAGHRVTRGQVRGDTGHDHQRHGQWRDIPVPATVSSTTGETQVADRGTEVAAADLRVDVGSDVIGVEEVVRRGTGPEVTQHPVQADEDRDLQQYR